MALKFQYNKTALQQLKKQLAIRENALPTLQAKESALRFEVKKAAKELHDAQEAYENKLKSYTNFLRMWPEFPHNLIEIKEVALDIKKIAGVKTPIFKDVLFDVKSYSFIVEPSWITKGIEMLQDLVKLKVHIDVAKKKLEILEYSRKKTTQKVNLYEKVQIPEYKRAILKIKRFMEDEENLAKSSQKILKARLAAAEAEAVS